MPLVLCERKSEVPLRASQSGVNVESGEPYLRAFQARRKQYEAGEASPTREHSPPEGEEGEREAGEVRPSGISRIDVAAKVRGSVSRSDRNGSGRLVRGLNGRREE